ncbi:MAG: HIT domain protein [Microgenomates group bacterium GW2011_GWA1_48_10]|uniref:HIT domain-containing protein n=1 Tax=Candidatus Gottesmanbacteria bacterium RIFCSPHIGHO2_01_FULL_47_48 TaxID=1798381 RepID=A0A1F6A2S3_9BACT|nr:MAG: HIT domain protein [Microgenomates group bacterium GW2011_GWA1_48_10]OGG18978.1 MAG: hypothetical protein A2721_02345 [Candidatus Gottesmanbacteria bacterium RIFCSPHIGHO2_01_FULL_47_48]
MFCGIVAGKIPAQKIAENEEFVAFLGIFPRFPGMTVVVTKRHTQDSYVYRSLSEDELAKFHLFARKVALAIDRALGSYRCIQVMEGFDIKDHAHLKLFPVYEGKMYDCSYEGDEKMSEEELKSVAEKIRKVV